MTVGEETSEENWAHKYSTEKWRFIVKDQGRHQWMGSY